MDYHGLNRSRTLLDISFISNLEINVLPTIISIVACIYLQLGHISSYGCQWWFRFIRRYCALSQSSGNLVWITIVSLTNELISLNVRYAASTGGFTLRISGGLGQSSSAAIVWGTIRREKKGFMYSRFAFASRPE